MVHGYHLILTMYGFWLPNDPRGSWSEFVRQWELLRFGRANKTMDRRSLRDLSKSEQELFDRSRKALRYPAVPSTDVKRWQSVSDLRIKFVGSVAALACGPIPRLHFCFHFS